MIEKVATNIGFIGLMAAGLWVFFYVCAAVWEKIERDCKGRRKRHRNEQAKRVLR